MGLFAVDIAALCTIYCLRGLEEKVLDDEGKGEGHEADQETNATGCRDLVSWVTAMDATGEFLGL